MKKILALSPVDIFPVTNGSASRIYNLTKGLSKKDKIWYLGTGIHNHKNKNCSCNEYSDLNSNSNVVLNFSRPGILLPSLINP